MEEAKNFLSESFLEAGAFAPETAPQNINKKAYFEGPEGQHFFLCIISIGAK